MVSVNRHQQRRAVAIDRTLIVFFVILGLRLFQLQVLGRSVYHQKSENNHVRQIPAPASRGLVLDRNGRVLVDNRPSYSLYIVPYEFRKNRIDAEVIASTIGLSVDEIEKKIAEFGGGPFTPVRLIQDMDFQTLSVVEENRIDLSGIFYQVEPVRIYPSAARMSHLIGYLSEIDRQELESLKSFGYNRGSLIGKSGIEKEYDSDLRGEIGYRYTEVDVKGREIGNFDRERDVPSVPGRNLKLTLDSEMQFYIEQLMEGKRGAVIVVDPRSGEVLSMASKPDYDLNPFAGKLDPDYWQALQNNPDKPLLHRAVQAQLPPGSTYKLVLAIAALESRKGISEMEADCDGQFQLGRRTFHCWRKEGHGHVRFIDAISWSCNVYFYHLMLKTGLEPWIHYGRLLGFGGKTNIDLGEENTGLLPDMRYLNRKYGKNGWGKGMWLNLSVGQGDLLVTPVQMVWLASVIGMEGRVGRPHLFQSVQDPVTGTWKEIDVNKEEIPGISQKTYDRIKTGMYRVVYGEGGTGAAARVAGIQVGGKTGTAQNPQGEDHAWFIGFAPLKNPEIALVVCVEHGGSGGGVAASIAGHVFRWYFSRRKAA